MARSGSVGVAVGGGLQMKLSIYDILLFILVICVCLFAWIMPGYPSQIPAEPEPGVASEQFIDWYLLPNGMIQFNFDLDLDGKADLNTLRRIKPSGSGMAHTQSDAEAEAPGWPTSLFLYYYDSGTHAWRWFAIERYPLLINYNGILYRDMEEDGINGNEMIYDDSIKNEKRI